MNAIPRRWLFWTPRASCIAFAMFLSLFALDVFREGFGFWKTLLALTLHLLPTFIVFVVLAIAWQWEWIGAVGFAGLALWYASATWPHHRDWVLIIAGPLLVIAALFFVNWLKHDELNARP